MDTAVCKVLAGGSCDPGSISTTSHLAVKTNEYMEDHGRQASPDRLCLPVLKFAGVTRMKRGLDPSG